MLRVHVDTLEQVEQLTSITQGLDMWTEMRVGHPCDVRVSPDQVSPLTSALARYGLQHSVMIPDVQALVDMTRMVPVSEETKARQGHSMDWTSYHPIEDMHSYLTYLQDTYDFVTLESIGQSHEGSDMIIAKVCKGGCGNKPAMWIDGGIHAREWISPATVTFMLKELVENDAAHADLLENLDW